MVLQAERSNAVECRFLSVTATHETDRYELVQLGQRAQHGNARIEMRAGPELDVLLPVFDPVRQRDKARNPQVVGDVKRPDAASPVGTLSPPLANIGIVEPREIDFASLEPVVPPHRIAIPLDQFEETLDDRLCERIAGR